MKRPELEPLLGALDHSATPSHQRWNKRVIMVVIVGFGIGLAALLYCVSTGSTPSSSASSSSSLINQHHHPESFSSTAYSDQPITNWTFIDRKADKLIDPADPQQSFRFISFNIPNLHIIEAKPSFHRIDPSEQEDAFRTLQALGATVTRIYTFAISGWFNGYDQSISHFQAAGQLNEELFQDFDMMLALANQNKIRLIIPLIDNQGLWFGGVKDFAVFYQSNADENINERTFYTNSTIRQGFKAFLRTLLWRKNSLTGVYYKDDPAILAWETVNEGIYKMKVSDVDDHIGFATESQKPTEEEMDEWTSDVAAFIKSIDANHLIMDGRYLAGRNVSKAMLEDENIDIISDHFYPMVQPHHYPITKRLSKLTSQVAGRKPFVIGEMGMIMPEYMDKIFANIADNDAIAGALVWSLRCHAKNGGFYHHHEYETKFQAYHYPGFDRNEPYGEKGVIELVREYTGIMQGTSPVPLAVPDTPMLLKTFSTREAIRWRGVVGGVSYRLERASSSMYVDSEGEGAEDIGGERSDMYEEGKEGIDDWQVGVDDLGKGERDIDGKEGEDIGSLEWQVLADNLDDEGSDPFVPYRDEKGANDCETTYYYRILARNSVGISLPSPIVAIECI